MCCSFFVCSSLNIADAYRDPRFDPASDIKTGYKTRSILTVPVTDRKGGCVAVIQAVNKKTADEKGGSGGSGGVVSARSMSASMVFSQEDVTILESMAVRVSLRRVVLCCVVPFRVASFSAHLRCLFALVCA